MFSVGDKVCLKIDSSKIGIVTDVTPVGNTTYQYEVFHNADETRTYYEEQLLPVYKEDKTETTFHDFLGAYAAFKMKLDSTSTIFSLNTGNIKFINFRLLKAMCIIIPMKQFINKKVTKHETVLIVIIQSII